MKKINNAGSVFLGKYSPEAMGDYLAGPNHTLPTCGNARFSGSLGVETFMKNTSIIEFNVEKLSRRGYTDLGDVFFNEESILMNENN